jgi:hypothetical protein
LPCCLYSSVFLFHLLFLSACIWAGGDSTAQYLEQRFDADRQSNMHSRGDTELHSHHTEKWRFDLHRLIVQTAYAGIVWAPIGHFWYSALDSAVLRIVKAGTWRFLALKMIGECAVLHPVSLCTYFSCTSLGVGDTHAEIKDQLVRDFMPTLCCE